MDRLRFAPSPTGFMHLGNLRTALYTYLLAENCGGTFILRVEDTDRDRYVAGAEDVIYDTLRVCGLKWDEGPVAYDDVSNTVTPQSAAYIQSERMKTGIYEKYAEVLIENGSAYRCFCKSETEKTGTESQNTPPNPKHKCPCRDIAKDAANTRGLAENYVIRQKIPLDGTVSFDDEVYGAIEFQCEDLDDQILLKSDKMPTYNFANVIDDHDMGITRVVRGNEYLSSTPKYTLLYRAFGWAEPAYIHVQQIMRDAAHKLSKRDGDAYFSDYIDKGYLPAAVLNYIALLGWSPRGEYAEREIFTLDELAEVFDVGGLSKAPAIFDEVKLRAINGRYLRGLSYDEFERLALPYARTSVTRSDVDLTPLLSALQARTEVLSEIPPQLDFIDALPDYDLQLFVNKKMKTTLQTSFTALRAVKPVFEELCDYSKDGVHTACFALIERLGVKNGWLLWAVRTALSGKAATPGGGVELAAALGKAETLRRIDTAVARLEAAGVVDL